MQLFDFVYKFVCAGSGRCIVVWVLRYIRNVKSYPGFSICARVLSLETSKPCSIHCLFCVVLNIVCV